MAIWPLPRIVFRELNLGDEKRPVALLTSAETWASLSAQLALPVVIQAEPASYSRALFDYLADNLPAQVKVIYAVGQGAPVMAGKVIAARRGVPLVIVPTALDSDWMLTPRARIDDQDGGSSRFVWEETGPATEIILDWTVLQAAPAEIRAGGMVDVLSIVTGLLDWRYAAQHGKTPREQRFESWAAALAAALAKEVIKGAPLMGQADGSGLHLLLNLMISAVQLSNQLGHTRAQYGSDHDLAEMIAAQTGDELPHAAVVGPCLLLISALHGQAPTALRTALEQAGVPLDQLRSTDVQLVMNNLPLLLNATQPPYSILHDMEPGSAPLNAALEAAGLVIRDHTWTLSDSQRMMAIHEAGQAQVEQPTEQTPAQQPFQGNAPQTGRVSPEAYPGEAPGAAGTALNL